MLILLLFTVAVIVMIEQKIISFTWKLLGKLIIGLLIVYVICMILDEIRLLTYFWF